MRNRAKCKLCGTLIESLHRHDYVPCECGEIAVEGGTDYWRVIAKNYQNFIRIDDDDKEVVITVLNDKEVEEKKDEMPKEPPEPSKILDEIISQYDRLPRDAMLQPASNSDILSVLLVVRRLWQK